MHTDEVSSISVGFIPLTYEKRNKITLRKVGRRDFLGDSTFQV